jgi:HSP90 family molecular chaperone
MATGEGGKDTSGIIGQFGVGFYSAFMVADKVEVFSKKCTPGAQAYCWTSTGTGAYEINEASEVPRGSTIVLHLKDSQKEFAKSFRLKSILQKHSNFVNFPIFMDDLQVNMVQAIWAKEKSECTQDEYVAFYKFIANAFDEPTYTLHYRADAPIELKALLFFPSTHMEKYGMARLDPSVSLYSKKVLIESASPDILPDWLRFVKGVVDSEDLPLSITREKMQDTKLLRQINEALTRRIIRYLDEMARKDREGYNQYFKEFGGFLKEGVCTDYNSKTAIAKLLRFQSNKLDDTDLTSLDEYISRCPPDQNQIYFLCAGSRESALASPYAESFKKNGTEFLILVNPIDEMVMSNLEKYNDKDLVGADRSSINLDKVTFPPPPKPHPKSQ